ncbi:hypothetical protein CsSME_00016335 [Camellia sinensis var. sinensis]
MTLLGATSEVLFNTCQLLPSGPAEEFTRSTNSNDFELADQDAHLFTGRPNQQLPLSEELSWSPEKYVAELNLPFVPERPAVQTSQLPYSGEEFFFYIYLQSFVYNHYIQSIYLLINYLFTLFDGENEQHIIVSLLCHRSYLNLRIKDGIVLNNPALAW